MATKRPKAIRAYRYGPPVCWNCEATSARQAAMRPTPGAARKNPAGLSRPRCAASKEERAPRPPPMMVLSIKAVRVQRPIARTRCGCGSVTRIEPLTAPHHSGRASLGDALPPVRTAVGGGQNHVHTRRTPLGGEIDRHTAERTSIRTRASRITAVYRNGSSGGSHKEGLVPKKVGPRSSARGGPAAASRKDDSRGIRNRWRRAQRATTPPGPRDAELSFAGVRHWSSGREFFWKVHDSREFP